MQIAQASYATVQSELTSGESVLWEYEQTLK